jgi:hypothetical protein
MKVLPALRATTGLASALLLLTRAATAAPIATPDAYSAFEDVLLTVSAPGVLQNDNPNGVAALNAALVSGVAHGTLALNTNGSFTYISAPNYNGPDSFTYKAVEAQAPITFTVDQPNSVMTINVQSQTYFVGGTSDSDTKPAQVSGTVTALVVPAAAPFSSIQIQDLNLSLAQPVSMTLCVQKILFCTATLTASIATNGLQITMLPTQAGPMVTVGAGGVFNQIGNKINTTGTVNLSGSGLAGLIDVPPSVALDSTDQPYDFNGGTITQSGATLVLTVPIDITQAFAASGDINNPGDYKVTVHVTGTVRATAPAPPPPQESATVTVSLNVLPTDDPPNGVNDRYYTRQNHTINIPATAAPTTETLCDIKSLWKYRTAVDLGTAWRAPEYNDTAWSSGNGILGYGDADITGNGIIPARANMALAASSTNPQYPTAYFRRAFTLTNAYDTVVPQMEVQRDDACIVYCNGVEVYRDKDIYTGGTVAPFPATGEIPWSQYAAATIPNADEIVYKSFTFSRSALREGTNIIAVEVHQATNTSSDMRFDLKATRTKGVQGLLANDTDPENDPLTAEIFTEPVNGSASVNPNGSFSYTPALGFTGTDTFTYRTLQNGNPASVPVTILTAGGSWKAKEPTANIHAENWKSAGYDDSAWLTANAPLGYGYADIAAASTLTFGADPLLKPPTYYFRKKFTLPVNRRLLGDLNIQLRRDAGASVWLNGVEIVRSNLAGAAGSLPAPAYADLALSRITAGPTDFIEYNVSSAFLVDGENVLAVEVHQGSADSGDVVFDLSISSASYSGGEVAIVVQGDDADNDNVSDTWERQFAFNMANPADANGDADGDGQSNRQEFLAGTDPRNARDVLRVQSASRSGANMLLGFPAMQNRPYQVECSPDMQNWSPSGFPFTSPTNQPQYSIQIPTGPGCQFFRIRCLTDWD